MDFVTSKDGTRIVYDRKGTGEPVILVDGAMCRGTAGPMQPLAALLAERFDVIAYDRRGRGESGDTPPYAVEREIEDIAALIEAAGGSAHVYGMSSGAVLAIRAAAVLGGQIRRLALYEPPTTTRDGDDVARHAAADYARELNALLAEGRRGDAVALFMRKVGVPADAIAGMRHAPMWPGMEVIAPTLAYDDAVMGDGSVPKEAARAIRVPSLVADGGSSPPFLREAADAVASALPFAHRLTLEGQTHDVAADALAPALAAFFGNEG
ncbi:alpha/beta fold hydrolase [Cohnella zeiphila]|uniref:Alpha/beta hydrolase n=1 Tax=Cohnella zeiphila TaxID=2761120 RepID=A0A7X0SKH8_9BACL|nr:alpha/beta hydrolase [Cohnella zeiphila]MBB6730395.1 alpha/beta hydrolase [Cohnella zeiphila]